MKRDEIRSKICSNIYSTGMIVEEADITEKSIDILQQLDGKTAGEIKKICNLILMFTDKSAILHI